MSRTRRVPTLLLFLTLILAGCTNPDETVDDDAANGNTDRNGGTGADGGAGDAGGAGNGTDGTGGGDNGAAPPPPGEGVDFTADFEQGLDDGWTRGSDLPGGASDDAWSANTTSEGARGGQQSLELSTGDAGEGTIWLMRTIDGLTPGAGYGVHVSVWAQPVDVQNGTLNDLVLYVGGESPTDDGSFAPENAGSRHMALRTPLPATGDWQEFTLDWGTPGPENGRMVVALGVSSSGGAPSTYRFDDLQVTFEPK